MTLLDWPERPALKQQVRVEVLKPDRVFFLDELGSYVLTGESYKALVPLLDGSRTADELCEELATLEPAHVFFALGQLLERGLLAPRDPTLPAEQAAFWQSIAAQPVPAALTVGLLTLAHLNGEPVAAALRESGFAVTDGASASQLVVVLAGHYLDPELEEINHRMRREEQSWMLAKPVGRRLWIGPIFHPQRSACWACLGFRLRLNLQAEEFVRRRHGATHPPEVSCAAHPATAILAAGLVALEVPRWLGGNRSLEGQLRTFEIVSSATQEHAVVKRPQCPVCGNPERFRAPRPVFLSSVPKMLGEETQRGATAKMVVDRMNDQVSPITGVVSWMADAAHAGHGVCYNIAAGHNFVMGMDTVEWLQHSIMTHTGGKGSTRTQAQASAIGEAVERYSGVFRGEERVKRASFRELQGLAVDPRDCLLFSEEQYKRRHVWNASHADTQLHAVPHPFEETATVDWTPLWSLTKGRFRYFLSAFCYCGHPESAKHFFCSGDSNGCAAGSTVEEAALYGFYELVERDAVAIWWYNRLRRPGVDLDSFDSPYLRQLRTYYRSLNREMWAIDVTSDIGIPSFVTVSRRVDQRQEDITFGFGAHLDPTSALLSAFSELNQFLPAVSRRDQDGHTIYEWPEQEAIRWWMNATVASERYLLPASEQPARRRDSFQAVSSTDLKSDLVQCVKIAGQAGLEVFVLDQSRPDIPMNVCRVVVPGMRHFWRRLAPGRLYDVPVSLGWLSQAIAEEDLNPYSIFV
jgi:bacteriocin biosynthesis cyclodehydratase domain-containing protein